MNGKPYYLSNQAKKLLSTLLPSCEEKKTLGFVQ